MELTLENPTTGQTETFRADENGVVTIPAGEWVVDGVIHIAKGAMVAGGKNFDGTEPDDGKGPTVHGVAL